MVGNVWEWVQGGERPKGPPPGAAPKGGGSDNNNDAIQRPMRGGSFIDTVDGRSNHAVMVSTRQTNTGDSAASNLGFRCAGNIAAATGAGVDDKKKSGETKRSDTKNANKSRKYKKDSGSSGTSQRKSDEDDVYVDEHTSKNIKVTVGGAGEADDVIEL